MGVTIEGTGPLVLPRKKSRKRSKRPNKFDPHEALTALVRTARVGIDDTRTAEIADGQGLAVDLGPPPHMPELRKLFVNEIHAARKHVDAVIHVVEFDEPRPRVHLAVLPPDVDLSATSTRWMLRDEMIEALAAKPTEDASTDDNRPLNPIDAYDALRARVSDALLLASALDDVLDAIPLVADREQSRRLSRLIYFAVELRKLLDAIVTEGELTAALLVKSPSAATASGPSPRPAPLDVDSTPRDIDLTLDEIRRIERKATQNLRRRRTKKKSRRT
jgi:hypothetical protein